MKTQTICVKQIILAIILLFFVHSVGHSQTVGIGSSSFTPKSTLDVKGNMTIGSTYGGTNAAPTNGLIVEGNVGIGTTGPNNLLQVANLINFDNTDFNTKIGYQAGKNIVVGAQYNTFVGYQAGLSSAGSSTNAAANNSAFGSLSFFSNTTGNGNVAMGYAALYLNTIGNYNTAIGINALYNNTTGNNNCAIGGQALSANTTGSYNVAVGYQALTQNTTGGSNTVMGYQALISNITGGSNTAYGFYTLNNNTGDGNTANGYAAMQFNTTGAYNTATGYACLYSNTTGGGNVATGYAALNLNTTGANNTAHGYQALSHNTTGNYNTANGLQSLYSNTTGTGNVANGFGALFGNTTADYSTATGYQALYNNTTGMGNTANGFSALFHNTTGNSNTANGSQALTTNTTGGVNTATGQGAMYFNTTGSYNTANGYTALYNNTTGNSNVMDGYQAGWGATTGSNNILIGTADIAASYNQVTTGSNNISIGYNVAVPTATASNQLNIGNLIYGTGLNGSGATISTGNVGIGTTGPANKLDVAGSMIVGSGYVGFAAPTDGLAVAGNVAFGTIAAKSNLHVLTGGVTSGLGATPAGRGITLTGNGGTDRIYFEAPDAPTGKRVFMLDNSSGVFSIGSLSNDASGFVTQNILSAIPNGNVGIGTAAPSYPLDINGSQQPGAGGSAGALRVINGVNDVGIHIATTSASGRDYVLFSSGGGTGLGVGNFNIFDNTAAVNRFSINSNGNVGIGTTSPAALLDVNGSAGNHTGVWANLSDRRLKENIEPLHGALSAILQLQGVQFNWKDSLKNAQYGRVRGFIAQDVAKVIPEWVKTRKDGYHYLETIGVDALLVEAIKEQQKTIEDQEKTIGMQQSEINKIKAENQQQQAMYDNRLKKLEDLFGIQAKK